MGHDSRPEGNDEPLITSLERIDLGRIVGGGGLRSISSFAAGLPSPILTLTASEPSRVMAAIEGLAGDRRSALFTSLGAAGVSQHVHGGASSSFARHVSALATSMAGSGIRSDLGLYGARITPALNIGVLDWVERITTTVTRIAESAARWLESVDEGIPAFVARHGWPVPLMKLPAGAVSQIIGLTDRSRREVSRQMLENFGPRTRLYGVHARALLGSPLLTSRREPLRQAIRAHQNGDHYASICTMLPLVEGLIADAAWAGATAPSKNVVRRGVKVLDPLHGAGWGWMKTCLEVVLLSSTSGLALFESVSPVEYEGLASSRSLNRHTALHGVARRYGTAQNALRLFLVLACLEEALGRARSIRARSMGVG